MKRYLPLIVLILTAVFIAWTLIEPKNKTEYDLNTFSKLPVLADGRIKPFDTVARTSLLIINGKQSVAIPTAKLPVKSTEWLLDVLFNPSVADAYQDIRIDHPEVLDLFKLRAEDGFEKTRFSFNQIAPSIAELERQAQLAEQVEDQVRTSFQREVVKLHSAVTLYQRLKHSLQMPDSPDFLHEVTAFANAVPAGIATVRAQQTGKPHDAEMFKAMEEMVRRYSFMAEAALLRPIPPAQASQGPSAWKSTGSALLQTFESGTVDPSVKAYAALGQTWKLHLPADFNTVVHAYAKQLAGQFPGETKKTATETRFNQAAPFYSSLSIYVFVFILAICSWLKWPDLLGKTAFYLMGLAWLIATGGIITRMMLEGRPPVTNLYSSAVFVGWGSVLLCLVLEKIYRNAIASAAGGLIGFSTLLIAHQLSLSGDTLEMMRAVLDSNFWLATHVVVVATGYAATFLAGFLAIVYVVRGVFTRSLDDASAQALGRMVYGIVCFATLFSLVGTILGGIWADQSWGRFWGWDPKENGALIIVIWNAIILHCRWGGLVKTRGLMALAIFGNIVTSWSWFGVNMLGVGLHSYGFMEAAFWWLLAFVTSQLALIAIAQRPLDKWRSFASKSAKRSLQSLSV